MHVAITGANGFIGQGLVQRIVGNHHVLGAEVAQLTLVDQTPSTGSLPEWCRHVAGDLAEHDVLDRVCDRPVDLMFHLASMPGSLAERDYEGGVRANVVAAMTLAHRLAEQAHRMNAVPRVVFASSVAVYGDLGGDDVHEDAPTNPGLSYGAHKLIIEMLLSDLSRRGELDARSIRLPGIVARPPVETGHGSAFMSQILHAAAQGRPYVCPVSPTAQAWWMSLPRAVDNLLRAAKIAADGLRPSRTWQLPVLRLGISELVDALCTRFGEDRRELITYEPDSRLERIFGCYPVLHTPQALALGFRSDTNANELIDNALLMTRGGW